MSKDESSGGDSGVQDAASPADIKKDSVFENRGSTKLIRIVTVMAYMFSVSFVAIVLSAYYIFLWQPPNSRLLHRAHLQAEPRVEYLMTSSKANHSQDHLEEMTKQELLPRNGTENRKREDDPPILLAEREDGLGKTNQSLVTLKSTLMQILRGRKNESRPLDFQGGTRKQSFNANSTSSTTGSYDLNLTLASTSAILGPEGNSTGMDYISRNNTGLVAENSRKSSNSSEKQLEEFTTTSIIWNLTNKTNVYRAGANPDEKVTARP